MKTMKQIFRILIIGWFGMSCQNNTEINEKNSDTINNYFSDSIEENHVNLYSINIKGLKTTIDSIYTITSFKLDSIDLDTVRKFYFDLQIVSAGDTSASYSKPDRILIDPLYAFSPQNADYLYNYGTFSFLFFKNDSFAKTAFREIFDLYIKETNEVIYTKDGIRLIYDVFSKGGSTYFYKDNVIIHKYRRCNDNYKEHERYENELLDYLYPSGSSESYGYFMRFCCSCPVNKSKEYR